MNKNLFLSKKELEQLLNNKEEFNKEVISSQGFVLELCKKYNLKPELNYMLDNINVFSAQFIYENYTLNKKQSLRLAQYFSPSKDTDNKLSEEDVGLYLKNGDMLPINTILKAYHINEYAKEIVLLEEHDEYQIRTILSKSTKHFSLEDILNINKKFLVEHPYLLNVHKKYFNDERYKTLYREVIFQSSLHPTLSHFENYPFSSDEKPLLEELLLNQKNYNYSNKTYDEYKNISGFKKLIDKFEFVDKYNSEDFSLFSNKETQKHVSFLQNCILNSEECIKRYETCKPILRLNLSLEQFYILVDQNFLDKLLSKVSDKYNVVDSLLDQVDAEYDKKLVDKAYHVSEIITKMYKDKVQLSNGKNITEVIEPSDITDLHMYLIYQKDKPVNEQIAQKNLFNIKNDLSDIYKNIFPDYLKTEKISYLLNRANYIFSQPNLEAATKFFKENININNFILLLSFSYKIINDKVYDLEEKNYQTELSSLLRYMHKQLLAQNENTTTASVHKILKYYTNLSKDAKKKNGLLEKLLSVTPDGEDTFENVDANFNFLRFEHLDLSNTSIEILKIIHQTRPDFDQYVINKKLELPEEFIYFCLYNTHDDRVAHFLCQYVGIHKKSILNNKSLTSAFLSNNKQKEIFPFDNEEHMEKCYHEMQEKLDKVKKIEEKIREVELLYPKHEFPYGRDDVYNQLLTDYDKNIDAAKRRVSNLNSFETINKSISLPEAVTLYLDLKDKCSELHEQFLENQNFISYSFMEKKLTILLENADFTTIKQFKDQHIKYNNDLITYYINNLSFNELNKCLENTSFIEILEEQISYDNKTEVQFASFKEEENILLAHKLYKIYNNKERSSSYKFLHYFSKENRDFIKDFAIDSLPRHIVYGYDFLPDDVTSYNERNFVKNNYSDEDILRIYHNLKNKSNFFSFHGSNADYKTFFKTVFFPEKRNYSEKEKLDDTKYLGFLQKIKDNEPALYTVLTNSNIFSEVLTYGNIYKDDNEIYISRDEAINTYFTNNFDIDTVLKGAAEILTLLKDSTYDYINDERTINYKLANYAITAFVHNTYYEKTDHNNYSNRVYSSYTTEEDTLKIMKFLYDHAPGHLLDRYVIGCADKPVEFFKKHIENFSDFSSLQNFIFPDNNVMPDNLRINDSYNEAVGQRLRGYFTALVEHAVDKKDINTIEYLSFITNQYSFAMKELDYEMRSKLYAHKNTSFLQCICIDQNIMSLLKNAQLVIRLEENLHEKDSKNSNKRNKI